MNTEQDTLSTEQKEEVFDSLMKKVREDTLPDDVLEYVRTNDRELIDALVKLVKHFADEPASVTPEMAAALPGITDSVLRLTKDMLKAYRFDKLESMYVERIGYMRQRMRED